MAGVRVGGVGKVEYTYEMEDNYLDLDRIVAELEAERNRLEQAITLLRERNGTATARKTTGTNGKVSSRPRSRGLTPAGRKRLSEMMKKRWAERKRKAKSS
jgi:hypothetical protein